MRCPAAVSVIVLLLLLTMDRPRCSEPEATTDELEIHYVGSCLWTGIRDVAIDGDYAYCIFPYGLTVLDVSDKSQPSFVSKLLLAGSGRRLAIRGNHAYVAAGGGGLQIIDISDPRAPRLMSVSDAPGNAYDVALSGNYACVADHGHGLRIIEISDPASPVPAGSVRSQGRPLNLMLSGNFAVLGCYGAAPQVVDISNPAAPVSVDSLNTPESVKILGLADTLAFAVDRRDSLRIYDITDINAPRQLSICAMPDGWPSRVVVQGQYAYVTVWGAGYPETIGLGMQVIDISDPASPSIAGEYQPWGDMAGVTVSGDYAYACVDDHGLDIVDISDPAKPVLVSQYKTPGAPVGIAVAGDYAYVAGSYSGLQIVDISNPAAPQPIGELRPPKSGRPTRDTGEYKPSNAVDVAMSDPYVCVADEWRGVHVIDVSIPAAPVLTGTCKMLYEAQKIAVSGNYAYVAAGEAGGIQIVDLSNPETPSPVGEYTNYDLMFFTDAVCVSGNVAWAVSRDLIGIDVSKPQQPSLLASCKIPRDARDVTVSGNYAYVANDRAGLSVVDISDLTNPTLLGSFDTPGESRSVVVSGDYAYLADYWGGVRIFDITDPAASRQVAAYNTPSLANDIAVAGEYVYVTDGAGLLVLRVTQ